MFVPDLVGLTPPCQPTSRPVHVPPLQTQDRIQSMPGFMGEDEQATKLPRKCTGGFQQRAILGFGEHRTIRRAIIGDLEAGQRISSKEPGPDTPGKDRFQEAHVVYDGPRSHWMVDLLLRLLPRSQISITAPLLFVPRRVTMGELLCLPI